YKYIRHLFRFKSKPGYLWLIWVPQRASGRKKIALIKVALNIMKIHLCKYQMLQKCLMQGLPIHDITQIKIKRNCNKSFQVLPSKPTHEIVYRAEKINEIKQELQKLYINSGGKLTYLYISGNPGSGKSQLSRQLSEDLFKGVNWETEATFVMTLHARNVDTILQSYQDFSRRLNCSESILQNVINSCKPIREKIKDLRSLIESRIKNWKRWWIIVDNVEDLNIISPLLPQMGDEVWNNGQIILTIQNRTAVPSDSLLTKHISLSCGMKIQECRRLLFLLSGTDVNDPLLEEVAEKLDHQPLAIAAAGAYFKKVKEANCFPTFSWQDYLEKLKCKREVTEEPLLKTSSAYPSTMSAAVSLAVEKSAENSFILKHTFYLFSLISFEPLPLHIITKYIQQLDQNCDKEDVYLAVKDCSLFILAEEEDCDVHLHRIIHEVTKSFSDCKETETKDDSQTQNDSLYSNRLASDNGEIYHIDVALAYNNIDSYDNIGEVYRAKGELDHANNYHQRALAIKEQQLGPDHVEVADIYNDIGEVYRAKGELDQALDYHKRANAITQKQLGPDHVDVALSYNKMGEVYYDKGELDQAKDYHQQALEIYKKQLGPDHIDVAHCYNKIGVLFRAKGELDQAEDYHQQELTIRENKLGPDHVDVADSYNNIGEVCFGKGELDQAKGYYERALVIIQKQLGPDHIDIAQSYANIGEVHRAKGELDQALDCHKRANAITEKQLGLNHVDVALSYNNIAHSYNRIGVVYYAKDSFDNIGEVYRAKDAYHKIGVVYHAKDCYNNIGVVCRAKDTYDNIAEVYLRKDSYDNIVSYDNIDSYDNIGEVYRSKDSYNKIGVVYYAKESYDNIDSFLSENWCNSYDNIDSYDNIVSYDYIEKQFGPDHVDVADSYHKIGLVYHAKGELDKAEDYYQRALAIKVKQLGLVHVDVADSYENIGEVYRAKVELDQAKDYYQRALAIKEMQLGPDHVDVAGSYDNIGEVYRAKGELDQAKDYYQRALGIKEIQLAPDHVDVADSYDNIGEVYYAKSELDQAKSYYERALAIKEKQSVPDDISIALSYNNIGAVYHAKGALDQAKDYYERALILITKFVKCVVLKMLPKPITLAYYAKDLIQNIDRLPRRGISRVCKNFISRIYKMEKKFYKEEKVSDGLFYEKYVLQMFQLFYNINEFSTIRTRMRKSGDMIRDQTYTLQTFKFSDIFFYCINKIGLHLLHGSYSSYIPTIVATIVEPAFHKQLGTIVGILACLGVILANFHLAGTTPRERDILKRIQSEGAISSATLDRILLGIPSGPHALLWSKLRSTAETSEIVRSISERLKTDWKNLLNKFALMRLSVSKISE
ncbi:Nephrocystin-3, partial [Paramuricea clavata]